MISWAALGDTEASALEATGNIEQLRTEEAELHDLQDKYEAAIALYSQASNRDVLHDVLQQLEDVAAHDMFAHLPNSASEKAQLYFLVMKNVGRVALELDEPHVAFKAYEAAAHLRTNDTAIWTKLATAAQKVGDAWYCRLACEHILSLEPWHSVALRLNEWASKLQDVELAPLELPTVELLPLAIDFDDVGENWTSLGRQLVACLSGNSANGFRDVVCVHSHVRYPSSASKHSSLSTSGGGSGLFRSIQRRSEDVMERAGEQQNTALTAEMPSFLRDATKHTPPLIAEEMAAEEEEDLLPSEQEEQQLASQATSGDGESGKNPRRSQRRLTRSASERQEEVSKVVDNSLVAQLEAKLLAPGEEPPSIGNVSFIELAIDALDRFPHPMPVTSPASATPQSARPEASAASPAAITVIRENLHEFRDRFQTAKPFQQAVEAYLQQTASLIRAVGKFPMVSEAIIEPGALCELVVQLWSWLCEVDERSWRFSAVLANMQPLAVLLAECLAELSSEGLCESYPGELVSYNLQLFTMHFLGELDKGGMGFEYEYQEDLLLRACWVTLLVNYGAPGSSSTAVPLMSLAKALFEQRLARPIYLPHRKQFNEVSLERFVLYEQRITVRSTLLQLTQQYNSFTTETDKDDLKTWLEQAMACLFTDEESDEFRRGCKLRLAIDSLNTRAPFGDVKKLTWLPLQVIHIALRLGEVASSVRLLQGFLRDVVEMLYSRADVRDDLAQHALQLLSRMDHSCLLGSAGASLGRLILYVCQLALVAARRTKWNLMKAIQEYSLLLSPSSTIPSALAKLLFGWVLDLRTLRMSKKVLSLVADAMTVCRRFSLQPGEHPFDAFANSTKYVVQALLQFLRVFEHFKQDSRAVVQGATLDILALLCTCCLRNTGWADAVKRIDLAHFCYVEFASMQGVVAEGMGPFARYVMTVAEQVWATSVQEQADSEQAVDIADWAATIVGQTYYDIYGLDIWADHLAVSLRLPIENDRLLRVWKFVHAKIQDETPRRQVIRSSLQLLRQHPLVLKPPVAGFGEDLRALYLTSDGVTDDELAVRLLEYIRTTPPQVAEPPQLADMYRTIYPLLVQHMLEIGPQDSVQANENSLIERLVLLLSDLAFNPWRLLSWWNLGLVAQAYHELMSDHVSEECIATLLPEAAHNPPPAFQLDPWRHQAILEFDVGTEGLLDELQPQATRLRDQLVNEGCLPRAYCSTSPDYLTNVLLYKSATRTMALRAFNMFRALLSAPECASQRADPQVSLLVSQSYEHIAVLAYYSYIELRHGASMKPVWLQLILKSVEDGLQCDGLSQQTRVNLELLQAKVISKVTQQPELRVSKLEAVKLVGADDKRYRLPLVYGINSTKAKLAMRELHQAALTSAGELPRAELFRLIEALNALRECRRIESAEARSVYRIARCLADLAEFVVPDQEIAEAFRSLGCTVTTGSPVGFWPAQTELTKIFDKKRPQIVGVWFPQQSSGGYEQIEQRTVKFDIRRIKYLGFFMELLEGTGGFAKGQELLSWVLSSKAKSAFTRWAATRVLAACMRILSKQLRPVSQTSEIDREELRQAVELITDVLSRTEFVTNFPFEDCIRTMLALLGKPAPGPDATSSAESAAAQLDQLLYLALQELPSLVQRNLATKRASKNKPTIPRTGPPTAVAQPTGNKRPLEQIGTATASGPPTAKAHTSKTKKRDSSDLQQSGKPKQEMKRQRALEKVRAVFVTGMAAAAGLTAQAVSGPSQTATSGPPGQATAAVPTIVVSDPAVSVPAPVTEQRQQLQTNDAATNIGGQMQSPAASTAGDLSAASHQTAVVAAAAVVSASEVCTDAKQPPISDSPI